MSEVDRIDNEFLHELGSVSQDVSTLMTNDIVKRTVDQSNTTPHVLHKLQSDLDLKQKEHPRFADPIQSLIDAEEKAVTLREKWRNTPRLKAIADLFGDVDDVFSKELMGDLLITLAFDDPKKRHPLLIAEMVRHITQGFPEGIKDITPYQIVGAVLLGKIVLPHITSNTQRWWLYR